MALPGARTQQSGAKPVTTSQVAERAITTGKLADGAITARKIERGAVTAEKIADGAVTFEKRVRERGTVHAEHFGVVSGGAEVDYGPRLQQAIDHAYASDGYGATVALPTATQAEPIKIATTINIVDDDERGNVKGVRLLGGGGGPSAFGGTYLNWVGANARAMINLRSRDCSLEGLSFMGSNSGTLDYAVEVTKPAGTNAGVYTSNAFRRLLFWGGAGGIANGMVVGDLVNGSYPLNGEALVFESCGFSAMPGVGIYVPNASAQAKNWRLSSCGWSGVESAISTGATGKVWFTAIACEVGHMTGTAFRLTGGDVDSVVLINPNVESVARFLDYTPGVSFGQVVITGGRFDYNDGLAADGEYIRVTGNGLVVLDGCKFDGGYTAKNISVALLGYENYAGQVHGSPMVEMRGCVLPRMDGGIRKFVKTGPVGARAKVSSSFATNFDRLSFTAGQAVEDQTIHYGANGVVAAVEYPGRLKYGAGSPEGAVVGKLGAQWMRLDGGSGTRRYLKESGAAETTISQAATLPTATLTVASTTGFASSGVVQIAGCNVAYTGKTSTTLTGCTGGTGDVTSGEPVEQALATGWVAKE